MKIFYSWQSDLDRSINQNFIGRALEKAVAKLSTDELIEIDPVVDRDTRGTIGSPDIVSAILSKIDAADIFVCDISIINGKSEISGRGKLRPSPNPNVLFELGYAASANNWKNTILVINTAFGGYDLLPFDINHRRIAAYSVSENTSQEIKNSEGKKLQRVFEEAISLIIAERRVPPEVKRLFQDEPELIKRLAFQKPDYWEFHLTKELLKHSLNEIRREYQDVRNGFVFRPSKRMTPSQMFNFFHEKNREISLLVTIFTKCISEELPKAWGLPGEPGNVAEIKILTDKLARLYKQLTEWEIDVASVLPPEIFNGALDIFKGHTQVLVYGIEEFSSALQSVFAKPVPTEELNLSINIKIPENWQEKYEAEFLKIEDYFRQNRDEWF